MLYVDLTWRATYDYRIPDGTYRSGFATLAETCVAAELAHCGCRVRPVWASVGVK